ncbi:MAG: hypothetical protein ACXV2B_04480 [Halobacteriota archaeon]
MNGPFACGVDVGAAVGPLVGLSGFTVAAAGVALGVAVAVAEAFCNCSCGGATLAGGEGLVFDGVVHPAILMSSTTESNTNGSAFFSGILMYRFIFLVIGFIFFHLPSTDP